MLSHFVLLTALFMLGKSVADEFCLVKAQLGGSPGTVYKLPETCEMCACDGSLRKFCAPDTACRQRKEEVYNSQHRRPCFDAASRYVHGSQVQQDCNVCNCRNATWICTQDECNYRYNSDNGGSKKKNEQTSGQSGVSDKESSEASHDEEAVAAPCKDTTTSRKCKAWKKRGLCDSRNAVKNKCKKSCGLCDADEGKKVVVVAEKEKDKEEETKEQEEKEENMLCADKDARCPAWIKRSHKYCQTNHFVKMNCMRSCEKCPQIEKKEETSNQSTETEEEEEEKEVNTQSAEEKEDVISQSTEEEEEEEPQQSCTDKHKHCEIWARRSSHCQTSSFVKIKCRKACGLCETSTNDSGDANKDQPTAEEVEEKRKYDEKQRYIEEWRQRLISEGKLYAKTGPDGCTFREGGRVYKWGSQLQGDCGICTCRKRSVDNYYFDCDDCFEDGTFRY